MTRRSLSVLIAEDETASRARLRQLLARHTDLVVTAECTSGPDAATAFRTIRPDIAFLDVQMPGYDGFDVLRRSDFCGTAVIFVTAFDRYAVRAFEVRAVDYLLKPFDDERFERALSHARDHLALRAIGSGGEVIESTLRVQPSLSISRLTIRDGASLRFLDLREITHVTAEDCYSRIHAGGRTHLVRESLASLERRLPMSAFRRVHRSTIINLEAVGSVEPLSHGDLLVRLSDRVSIRCSRRYRARLNLASLAARSNSITARV